MLGQAKKMTADGHCLRFDHHEEMAKATEACVVGIHDASFANELNHSSQQGYLTLLTTAAIKKGNAAVHLVDWGSSKIRERVACPRPLHLRTDAPGGIDLRSDTLRANLHGRQQGSFIPED